MNEPPGNHQTDAGGETETIGLAVDHSTDADGEADIDIAVLDSIRGLYLRGDPVPQELFTRVRFALELDSVERDLARICEDMEVAAAVRGTEHARTITFECDSLTIAITISPSGNNHNRVDGWLAPAGCLRVELRTPHRCSHTMSDDGGRFAFDDVAAGEMQLAVQPAPGSPVELTRTVVTHPIVL